MKSDYSIKDADHVNYIVSFVFDCLMHHKFYYSAYTLMELRDQEHLELNPIIHNVAKLRAMYLNLKQHYSESLDYKYQNLSHSIESDLTSVSLTVTNFVSDKYIACNNSRW